MTHPGLRRAARLIGVVVAFGGVFMPLSSGTAAAAVPITFALTGTFTEGVQASYFGAAGEAEVAVVGLPWSVSYDYGGDAKSLTFTGIHPGPDPGSVTCRVSIGGRTVVTRTNDAPPAAGGVGAYCNVVDLGSGFRAN